MNTNAIILLHGHAVLTEGEYKKFTKGDTIWGIDRNPEALKRWSIEDEAEALEELKNYKCTYDKGNLYYIDEYALEYCETDEDGEFIEGSTFEMYEIAEEAV